MRKLKNVLGLLLIVLFLPLLIINIVLIVKDYINPNEVPDFLGYKPFIVLSGSMEPTIKVGDVVVVKKYDDYSNLKQGDVVAFKEEKSVVTHRIVAINDEDGQRHYTTKGDSNNIDDNFSVTPDKIEGKYVLRIGKLGNLAMYIQTPVGGALFISIPFIIFILYDIVKKTRSRNEQMEKEAELRKEIEKLKEENSEMKK
ncbi:MAG: signal peptidase I [Clostridia bacterium]|nr:signal peptidase I [Clostridia bacterium]